MAYITVLRQRNKMKIIKVPYWTNSRHHLLDDGKVICITDAIRFKRQIGKQSLQKYWVCYKDNHDEFTKISKNFSPSD